MPFRHRALHAPGRSLLLCLPLRGDRVLGTPARCLLRRLRRRLPCLGHGVRVLAGKLLLRWRALQELSGLGASARGRGLGVDLLIHQLQRLPVGLLGLLARRRVQHDARGLALQRRRRLAQRGLSRRAGGGPRGGALGGEPEVQGGVVEGDKLGVRAPDVDDVLLLLQGAPDVHGLPGAAAKVPGEQPRHDLLFGRGCGHCSA
mmetsp:Transcript_88106/g.272987  ORF Transcript_88106/g.272987 Transcript_88106/m.272987 type:complete len:203 (-) Transcript_88106:54-662(-)